MPINATVVIAACLALVLTAGASSPREAPRPPSVHAAYIAEHRERERFINPLLVRMTLDEKVGQLVQLPSGAWEEDCSLKPELVKLLRKGHIGAFIGVDGAARTHCVQTIAVEKPRPSIARYGPVRPGTAR